MPTATVDQRPKEAGHNRSCELVLGVDTHKDVHVAAVLTVLGALLATRSFPATRAGYRDLLAWASSFGMVGRAGVEGTGSYGASLCRYLMTQDVRVIEVDRPDRAMRRRHGKTDTIDAEAAARAVLAGRARTHPKYSEGSVEDLRVAKMVKDSAVSARTQAINQLKAILVCGDPQLREQLEPLRNPALFAACAELNPEHGVVHQALQLLAVRIRHLSEQITALKKQITLTIRALNSDLLKVFGVGPDSAAALLIAAGENHNRLTSEASFAALCGASPVEHSSGKSRHRRLNRGGNRQANAALYRIVLTRLRREERTQHYLERRSAEGKTKREIIRCLKRYVAREIYQYIRAVSLPQPAPGTG
ncbi:IS110 family RNA-guided transposase [Streptomyces mirabilis]|uniref:IS110 family transposase n=1 Tax=Streptomyces mirabilis TaxID=68239 RepID=UPI0036F0369C